MTVLIVLPVKPPKRPRLFTKKTKDGRRRWAAANPEKRRAAQKRYYSNPVNRAREKERRWRYRQRPEYKTRAAAYQRAAYQRKWRAANLERARATQRRSRGIPEPTRPRPEHCEICGQAAGGLTLHLDHCHATKKFRGWLCGKCNRAIGIFADDPARLERAAAYLRAI